jgi:hypothetical protein
VGWANLWAKAKENHERSTKIRWRTRAFVIGAIFAGAGGHGLYSDVTHQIHGRPATATLMAHLKQCTVEYQRIGEPERKDQLPCELAEEFQRRVGSNKVKLSRDYVARVQLALEDGRTHEAIVDDIKLGSYGLPIGTTLPVIYNANNPADVRAKMSWQTLQVPLILLAIGIPFLVLSFGVSLAAVFRWAFRSREEEAVSTTSEPLAFSNQVSGQKDKMVFGSPAARKAYDMYSPKTGTAPRPTFGTRNR